MTTRVLGLLPNLLGVSPGQLSSIEAWDPVLRRAGIEIDYLPFETGRLHDALYGGGSRATLAVEMMRSYAHRVRTAMVRGYDAAFVYREAALVGPALFERLAARRLPVIYQLDDPLHVRYRSPLTGYLSYLKFPSKVASICRLSRAVIVNSAPLERYVRRFNDNVWRVPSVIDTDRYCPAPTVARGPVCVGWSGSPTTTQNLRLIDEPLRALSSRNDVRLHFIGGLEFPVRDVAFTSQPWRHQSEVDDLRQFDIGLVPLPDNPWNHWKFSLKTAQYMALGIPPVASPLGAVPDQIDHGVNGFLAATGHEWVEHVTRLVESRALRLEMGAHAARKAQSEFSLRSQAEHIVAAFTSAFE